MRLRRASPNVYAKMVQAGGRSSFPVFKGKVYTRQLRGGGLAPVFSKLAAPLLGKVGGPMINKIGMRLLRNLPTIGKNVAKSVAPDILRSAVNVGNDILSGKAKPNKQTLVKALKKNQKSILQKTMNIIKKEAFRKGGVRKKKMKGGNLKLMRRTRGKKVNVNDIFSSL